MFQFFQSLLIIGLLFNSATASDKKSDVGESMILIYEVDKKKINQQIETSFGSKKTLLEKIAEVTPNPDNLKIPSRVEDYTHALSDVIYKRLDPHIDQKFIVVPVGLSQIKIILPMMEPKKLSSLKKQIINTGKLEFRIAASKQIHGDLAKIALESKSKEVAVNKQILARWVKLDEDAFDAELVTRRSTTDENEVLILVEDTVVRGKDIKSVKQKNGDDGLPCIEFILNSNGSKAMEKITSEHLPKDNGRLKYFLGLIVDGEMIFAPRINSTVSDEIIISGTFGNQKSQSLICAINSCRFPTAVHPAPISESVTKTNISQMKPSIAKEKNQQTDALPNSVDSEKETSDQADKSSNSVDEAESNSRMVVIVSATIAVIAFLCFIFYKFMTVAGQSKSIQ